MRVLRLCPVTWRIFDDERMVIDLDTARELWESKEATSTCKYFIKLTEVGFQIEFVKDIFRDW